jgi:hypothetical protein
MNRFSKAVSTGFDPELHLERIGLANQTTMLSSESLDIAEMLRIACCLATERGVEVCAPVHDAMLIAAPLHRLDADAAAMREAMREASAAVLAGFELGTDVKVVRYPDRYSDPRGKEMWRRVMRLIGDGESEPWLRVRCQPGVTAL